MRASYTENAKIFKAFCDENRLCILDLLQGGEKCACKLLDELHIGQSTLSHHMKILCESGVVTARKEGKWTHYSISEEGSRRAAQLLTQILSTTDSGCTSAVGTKCVERMEHKMEQRKKLYVLTGFLGAGKTSLLLHLLDALKEKKIGIIQNEFGKLGIDGEILRRDGIELTEISRGSIFCSCLKLSFVQALAELGGRDLEYVFVESSGLADPSNIEEILFAVKALAGDVYELKGVICLVDGVNFLSQVSDVETVDRQLAHCHLAAINKVDLIDETQCTRVIEAVRRVNPACELITCREGDIGTAFLKEDLMSRQWAVCEDTLNQIDNKPKTLSLLFQDVMPQEHLNAFLNAVLPDCYRIKGFFHLEEGWRQIDVVGERIDYKPCEPKPESQLVFLSRIGPQVIRVIDTAWKDLVQLPMKLKN